MIRIANISGATGDDPGAMKRMVEKEEIDAITGDFLSEMNISWNSIEMQSTPSSGYDKGFLNQFEQSVDAIAAKCVRLVTNAGALNPTELARRVKEIVAKHGKDLKVSVVVGDNITDQIGKEEFRHLDNGSPISTWDRKPHVAVAYTGCRAIVAALNAGSDIVICGRVTDASPVIGLAAWWHKWNLDQGFYDELAGSLVAGHLIECGPYLTGANFSGFRSHVDMSFVELGFPIVEIYADGTAVVTKEKEMAGFVQVDNVTAQVLYELQGELYLNPDVVADISTVELESVGIDRVKIKNVKGFPPPSTSKVIVNAIGGYQVQALFFINGLNVNEKVQMMKNQLNSAFRNSNFKKLVISVIGTPQENSRVQSLGTCVLRVFVQAERKEDVDFAHFKQLVYAIRMQSYPGYHMDLDFRMMEPKMFMELWPTTIDQAKIKQSVILWDGKVIEVGAPSLFSEIPRERPSYETAHPLLLSTFGETQIVPLGTIVHARSGDKGNNLNVGFFVRHEDEYPWLQSLLTVDKLKELLGNENREGIRIERCEFPLLKAVHFRIIDFLDGGIASSSRIDGLGKGVGEFLRARWVPVPIKFISRGAI